MRPRARPSVAGACAHAGGRRGILRTVGTGAVNSRDASVSVNRCRPIKYYIDEIILLLYCCGAIGLSAVLTPIWLGPLLGGTPLRLQLLVQVLDRILEYIAFGEML